MQIQPWQGIICMKNLLAGVGHDDLGHLGKVDIRSAALHATSNHSDFISRLERRLVPAELFDQARRAAELSAPSYRFSRVVRHGHDDERMRIDELKLNNGSSKECQVVFVAAGISMVSE